MQMQKVNVSELSGAALDWAVGVAEGRQPGAYKGVVRATAHPDCPDSAPMFGPELNYSTNWAQGGLIIEREKISVLDANGCWGARKTYWDDSKASSDHFGPAPLIAAMRCYVTSKLGEAVEVPEELLG